MFDDVAPQVSLDRQIQAVEREIKQREYVYPRRVAAQKMTQKQADEEIGFMRAVLATLRASKPALQLVASISRFTEGGKDADDDAATVNSLRERALQIVKGETP